MAKSFCILNISDGVIQNPKAIKTLIDSLKDGKYLVEINAQNQRSLQQNRYYFGLVIPLIQQGIKDLGTEITKEECHEFLKSRFNCQELVNTDTGECVQIPRSTTALSKEQFGEYISRIQQFGAEFLSIVIPSPNEQMALHYED